MSRVYYKEAMGAVVVFDITNSSTLEAASEWKQDLDTKVRLDSGQPIPAVLLANKCDLTGRDEALVSSLDSFCKDNSFLGWFETSAKVCATIAGEYVPSLTVSVGCLEVITLGYSADHLLIISGIGFCLTNLIDFISKNVQIARLHSA